MKRLLLLAVMLAVTWLLPKASQAEEITVSAAASLTNAFTELKGLFERQHPQTKVHLNFAASTPLLKQIQEGAPVDVFASADQETMDSAVKAKVIKEASRVNFVRNTLVLIVPKGSKKPAKLEDITGYERLAIGNPDSVPAGRYTKQALTKVGIWDKAEKKAIFGTNVRQVLDYVARGEVDAGFVYGTDAKKQADKVETVLVLDGHKPILYPIAQVSTGKNPKGGMEFLNLVLSPEGQAVLDKYGFARP